MPAEPGASLMDALGMTRAQARWYDRLTLQSGKSVDDVAEALGCPVPELRAALGPLAAAGLVALEGDRLTVVPMSTALGRVLRTLADDAARWHDLLADVVTALPNLAGPARPATSAEVAGITPLDGEITSGGDVPRLLRRLLDNTVGDVRWLRPGRPDLLEEQVVAVMDEVVAGGRTSRVIYPLRTWQDHPELLHRREAAGEEVRLAVEVPTRLMLVGTTHAMLPEPLGSHHEPRTLLRQRGLVEAMGLWFEALWAAAEPLPSPESGDARAGLRRFLLQELATGAQDEQIARRLGVSLRTVRRRVAELLEELGAETRFQAGVEAARRGWL